MKRRISLLIVCWLMIVLAGCSDPPQAQPDHQQSAYQVVDSQGRTVKLMHKPQRIIPLSISTDEIVVNLVPLERIAALTYLSDDAGISNITEQAKLVAKKVKANPEQIIALQPDLVIIPDWQPQELIQTLRESGLPVYVYHAPSTIEDIKTNIRDIAKVLGEQAAGNRIIAKMDEDLVKINEKVDAMPPEKRVIVLQFTLLGASGGRESLFDDICHYAGVQNGAALAGLGKYETMSQEQIVKVNPDVFIMPMWDYTGENNMLQYKELVHQDPGLQSVKAVRSNRLILLPDRYQNSSSQYIVQGIRDVAQAAYPELSWK
ncbi:ABC transporter substrate-binding protein [bacterium BFN5]|nr:ABC transporter substrate-binding protein [bacterium BFN5]QJW44868.1 ABC transporter substrate-binding protein [bacterium BFN5]